MKAKTNSITVDGAETKTEKENIASCTGATDVGVGTSPAAAVEEEQKRDLMYLGPTIAGVVTHSIVFKDGVLPKKAQECVNEFPNMKRLFVEIDKVSDTVKELNKRQSALSAIYALTLQKFSRR